MIDLATFTKRSEFIEHEANLQGYIKHLEGEVTILNEKLQEYEGVKPTNEEAETEFQKLFWIPYGRKGSLKKTRRKWFNLSKKKQALAAEYVPGYVKATPANSIPARKNGETFLYNECWNDTLPIPTNQNGRPDVYRSTAYAIERLEDKELEQKKLEQGRKLRQANRGTNIRDRLKLNS